MQQLEFMNGSVLKLKILLLLLLPTLLYSQSEGAFGFRRFANKAALDATSVNNSGKSESRRAYVHSTGLYYVWDGSTWIAEIAVDTFSFANDTLTLSLLRDGVPAKKVRIEGGSSLVDTVYDYDDLRAYAGTSPLVFVKKVGIRGFFLQNNQGLALDDNGINITGNDEWVRYGEDTTMVNVKWFEAVGDSITDDNTAIQAALAYCEGHPSSTLYFPAGKYRYTSQIFSYKPVDINIKGDGMNQTYLLPVNVNGIYFRTDSTTTVTDGKYGLAEMRDFQISDLSILRVGTNAYSNKVIGIYLRGGFNTKLENVRVEEFFATSGGGIGGIGIRLDNTIPGDNDAVQHTTFDNVYVTECDTGIVTRLHNTMIWHDVKVDQSRKFGVVLRNGVYWNKGMVQGSENCGIFFDHTANPFVLQDIRLESVYFEANAYNAPKYGTLYKPDNVNANTINITHCTFTGPGSAKLFNLRRVINSSIIHNRYSGSTTDTISLTSFYNVKFGGDNYYALKLITSDSYIDWISGNGAGLTQEWVGHTIGKGSPGDYALTVGGSAIVDDSLAIGATNPTAKLDVNGISRLRSVTGIVPTTLTGRDASGYVGTVSVGTGLSLSGGTLNNTVTNTNIYTDDGTVDDPERNVILDSLQVLGIGQFANFPTLDLDGTSKGYFYDPGSDFVGMVNGDGSTGVYTQSYVNSTFAALAVTNATGKTSTVVSSTDNSIPAGVYGDATPFYFFQAIGVGGTDTTVVTDLNDAFIDLAVINYNVAAGADINITGIKGTEWEGRLLIVKNSSLSGNTVTLKANDVASTNIYRFDFQEDYVLNPGESVWLISGRTVNKQWQLIGANNSGLGNNIYNSNGTTSENTRELTIRPGGTLTFTATDTTAGKFPFRISVTGNEPDLQLWKGNTDSTWISQSDIDYELGSSATLNVYSQEVLYLRADSIVLQGVNAETKLHYVAGITNGGTIKEIQGSSDGDIISWNSAGYWEVTAGGAGGDGIYGGSGNIPDNTVATVAANGDFQIAYDGGNPAFEVDDGLNQAYISGQSGTYSVYADNSNSGLVSGTATWLVGSDFALTATASVANTNTAADRLVIKTNSSGTASTSFGGGITFLGESSTTDDRNMGKISSIWDNATDASRRSGFVFSLVSNGSSTLTDCASIKMVGTNNPELSLGVSSPMLMRANSLTTAQSFTVGNSSQALTLGGSSGTVTVSSSSNSGSAIVLNPSGSIGSVQIAAANDNNTSGTKNWMTFISNFNPTSGTRVMNYLTFSQNINQTGGANGITRSINIATTITAAADFRAIEIATNSSSAKGIYQTGSSTTNNLVGNTGFGATTTPDDVVEVTGNIELTTAGNKLKIATGSNASVGTATLSGGTVTVNTTAVTASSKVFLSIETFGGTPGVLEVGTITAGTSFVINSSSVIDSSDVNWWIIN